MLVCSSSSNAASSSLLQATNQSRSRNTKKNTRWQYLRLAHPSHQAHRHGSAQNHQQRLKKHSRKCLRLCHHYCPRPPEPRWLPHCHPRTADPPWPPDPIKQTIPKSGSQKRRWRERERSKSGLPNVMMQPHLQ